MAIAKQEGKQPESLKGRVLRSFYYQGKALAVGASCELPRVFALEMVAANKLELSPAAPAPAPASPKPEEPKAAKPEAEAPKGKKGA